MRDYSALIAGANEPGGNLLSRTPKMENQPSCGIVFSRQNPLPPLQVENLVGETCIFISFFEARTLIYMITPGRLSRSSSRERTRKYFRIIKHEPEERDL